ncbi:MAG: hypothetical protein ABSG65_18640 [Bryobacteraceae bacterium]|jgi:hypothetical protein
MATDIEVAANPGNAPKSTAPHTENGVPVSRLDGLRHSLGVKPDGISMGDHSELFQIERDLTRSFQPRTSRQEDWILQMAYARWQLLRWRRVEAEELSEPSFSDPQCQARAMELLTYRQARQQAAINKAFERLQRSARTRTKAKPPPAP